MKRNLVGKILDKIKIFVQDFVPIRTALRVPNLHCDENSYGENRGEVGKSLVTTGRMTILQ